MGGGGGAGGDAFTGGGGGRRRLQRRRFAAARAVPRWRWWGLLGRRRQSQRRSGIGIGMGTGTRPPVGPLSGGEPLRALSTRTRQFGVKSLSEEIQSCRRSTARRSEWSGAGPSALVSRSESRVPPTGAPRASPLEFRCGGMGAGQRWWRWHQASVVRLHQGRAGLHGLRARARLARHASEIKIRRRARTTRLSATTSHQGGPSRSRAKAALTAMFPDPYRRK